MWNKFWTHWFIIKIILSKFIFYERYDYFYTYTFKALIGQLNCVITQTKTIYFLIIYFFRSHLFINRQNDNANLKISQDLAKRLLYRPSRYDFSLKFKHSFINSLHLGLLTSSFNAWPKFDYQKSAASYKRDT